MWKTLLICLLVITCLEFKLANLASILPNRLVQLSGTNTIGRLNGSQGIVAITTSSSINLQWPMLTTPSPDIPAPGSLATTTTTITTTSASTTTRRNSNQNLNQDDSGPGQGLPSVNSAPNKNNGTTSQSPSDSDDGAGGTNQPPEENGHKKQTNQSTVTTTGNDTSVPPPPPPQPPNFNTNDKSGGSSEQANNSYELSILFYSVFIVYVSFVKLLYHNVHFIKHNLTEQGILMLFGIFWQLIIRQLTSDYDSLPHFNSRIFFYLFLPSTVLESASLLSNKWLFFNLLQILTHSIVGTVLYASAMGFTIYSLGRSNIFTLNWIDAPISAGSAASTILTGSSLAEQSIRGPSSAFATSDYQWLTTSSDNSSLASSSSFHKLQLQLQQQQSGQQFESRVGLGPDAHEFSNLTLADCLIFGTILSSIDSAPMLNVFKQYQVNDKLYYLVLGENLMNNAVVMMIFSLLIDFFGTTRLTVVKIYIAMLQFFADLLGAILIGFALALFALISVRLTKRFQLANHLMSSYQNQCQAMVETLLILKLAYLTYTLANLSGTSSIVSLATFGILNDQYIKHNLNLRSQLAFRQVILAMKTMGFSLVYPLLGMLLVDTALNSSSSNYPHHQRHQRHHHHDHHHNHHHPNQQHQSHSNQQHQQQHQFGSKLKLESTDLIVDGRHQRDNDAAAAWQYQLINDTASHRNAGQHQHLLDYHQQDFHNLKTSMSVASKRLATVAGVDWNFKFLSIVVLLTIVYRFLIVIALGLLGNLLTCGQIKIKFKEQVLMAYGGFKGPLSIALVHSLIEHNDHKDRMASSKDLFKYTLLFNIFISAVVAGTLLRPLVAKIQSTLIGHLPTNLDETTNRTIVFEQINYKLTEYVSHGLNSVLGHTRSPYEKFIEFNETHIKRWLVRDSTTNTHWLSIFYDNLILDETLNANCFYIATEDPTTMRAFRNQQQQRRQAAVPTEAAPTMTSGQLLDPSGRPASNNRARSPAYPGTHRTGQQRPGVGFMDTISENRVAPASNLTSIDSTGLAADTGARHHQLEPAGTTKYRSRSNRNASHRSGLSNRTRLPLRLDHDSEQIPDEASGPAPVRQANDKEALREFVMLNLKLDEAKKRRHAAHKRLPRVGTKTTHLATTLSTSESEGPNYGPPSSKYRRTSGATNPAMLDDSSELLSGTDDHDGSHNHNHNHNRGRGQVQRLADSSSERQRKQRLLSDLELRLADSGASGQRSRTSGQTFRLGTAVMKPTGAGRIDRRLAADDKAVTVASSGAAARGRRVRVAAGAPGPSKRLTHQADDGDPSVAANLNVADKLQLLALSQAEKDQMGEHRQEE